MIINYLEYPLVDGYIHNWLVAGPQVTPIQDLERFSEGDDSDKAQILQQYHTPDPGVTALPVDRDEFEFGGTKLTWRYVRCQHDHFVSDFTTCRLWSHLRSWAYTQIKCSTPQQVTFVLTTNGPVEVWLNGKSIIRQEQFQPNLQNIRFQASLEPKENELLVGCEQVAGRETASLMALQLADIADVDTLKVQVPTHAKFPSRHQRLERILEYAYLEEVVNHRGAHFNLRWAEDLSEQLRYCYQIQDVRNRIYVSGDWDSDPINPVDVGHEFRLYERPFRVVLVAPGLEYYEHDLRYQRDLPIHVLDTAYSSVPYGTFSQRNREALEEATKYETNLFAEIAKMELERWSGLNADLVLASIEKVNLREYGSDIELIGLLGIMARYMSNPSFPEKLKQPLEQCVLNFKYWLDEDTGPDAIPYTLENNSIVSHTCEILAGQLYPDRTFTNSKKTGKWHRKKGQQLALDWMRKRGTTGFQDWDSNCYYEQILAALSHLTSLAANEAVRDMAAVVMDKMFFLMAVNSYKGIFGSTHGRTNASMIKSAQLEATSGLMRMMWGMGIYNHHILGTVSLACSKYEFPLLIADIAADQPQEMLNKEHHLSAGGHEINKVTYKTPDYMLCSAQDYRPGEKGSQEHIWQATLGSEAVVFVNHPACVSEDEPQRPGFWRGNATLPRAAQWNDVLIAVYKLPDNDWMGYTHAYFPIYQFDEHAIKNGWAFARKGDGYLALTAARGIELIKRGPDGYRELRSYGRHNIWLCQMGRASLDGSFEEFQKKVLSRRPKWQELTVRYKTLRKERLSFGWEEPLTVNDEEQPITGFKHIENPYCVAEYPASQMDISFGEFLFRLNFT